MNTPPNLSTYSLIWNERTTNTSIDCVSYSNLAKSILHELGHARAGNLTNGNGYFEQLTDDTHKEGHNGKNKKTCVMCYSDEMTDEQMGQWIKEPQFCEGHLQMLLNITLKEKRDEN